jgi:hypothetical protein
VDWLLDTSLSSYQTVYISYWDYVDPNAMYANSDYYEAALFESANPVCVIAYDAQEYNFGNNASFTSTTMALGGTGTPVAGCVGMFFNHQAFNMTINAGRWEQHEILITPSTTYTGTTQYPPPNCNDLSPSTPGCGNGASQFYINGVLQTNIQNANINGNDNVANPVLQVGGVITSFSNSGESTRCTVFSSTGGGTCPGTQPGTGAPQPFHRFFDDIIILYQ